MKDFLWAAVKHVAKYREEYIWPFIAIIPFSLLYVLLKWISGDVQIDYKAMLNYMMLTVPLYIAKRTAATMQGFLYDDLTHEEYVKADWKSKLVNNASPIGVFVVTLIFVYFMVRG